MNPENQAGPNFEYRKGNVDMSVYRSKEPINKEMIDDHILNFLYSKAGDNEELLKVSDFSIELLLFKDAKGFIKFNIGSGNKMQSEISLTGEDLNNFITVIQQHGLGLNLSEN
jgi:hypothetical protein